jgi:predicted amidohydrolase YtcJ
MSDVLFNDAMIWAGVPPRPVHGWLHVRDGAVAGFGEGRPPFCSEVHELLGAHVLPGFVDCHSHLTVGAWMPRMIDASRWCTSGDIIRAISIEAELRPQGTWLVAMDADLERLGRRLPHPDDLDRAAMGRCVLIADFSLHQSLVSSAVIRALAEAGVSDRNDIDRRGGRPTGVIWESVHAAAFRMALEDMAQVMGEQGRPGLLDTEVERHLACGITACHDPCVPPSLTAELDALRKRTPLRLSWSLVAESGMLDPASHAELCGCYGEGPASAKLFADGAHRCALCLDPGHVLHMMSRAAGAAFKGDLRLIAGLARYKSVYRGGKFVSPYLRMDQNELAKRLESLASTGVRPKVHAVGNHAAVCVADALIAAGSPAATLEHLTFLTDRDVDCVARTRAVASMQPGFIDRFGIAILKRGMTPRLRAYPLASLRRAGVAVALSSDHPCGPLPPLENMRKAVLRKVPDGRVVDQREALSLAEAVEAYTILGHQAIHGHPGHGISEGAVADLAVLSGDPLSPDTHVRQTWINGQLAWNLDGSCREQRTSPKSS